MTTVDSHDPLPPWLAAGIRRAAVLAALSWLGFFGAVAVLFIGVLAVLLLGEFESIFPPLFWLTVFGLIMVWFGREVLAKLRLALRPEESGEVAYLRRFGPVMEVGRRVEAELEDPGCARYGGGLTLTRNWVVVSGRGRIFVRRLEDLSWAFSRTEAVKLLGSVPLCWWYLAVLRCAGAPEAEARASKAQVLRFLEDLSARAPGVVIGFDARLEEMWRLDPESFANAAAKFPRMRS